jgi:pyruvate/2-oxoglutarate dehydrogenase complex dihydrolipoamide acyltransferase (E2) component
VALLVEVPPLAVPLAAELLVREGQTVVVQQAVSLGAAEPAPPPPPGAVAKPQAQKPAAGKPQQRPPFRNNRY